MMTDWAWYRDIIHASPRCACGINDAGQRYVDTICQPTVDEAQLKNAIRSAMFPPGGETHIEYGVESIDTEIAGFQLVGTDASAQRFSTHQRSHTVWPDGAKYVTGWKKKQ